MSLQLINESMQHDLQNSFLEDSKVKLEYGYLILELTFVIAGKKSHSKSKLLSSRHGKNFFLVSLIIT